MNSNIGWMLVTAGMMILAASGNLNLLIVLLPVAVVLACGFSWLSRGYRA